MCGSDLNIDNFAFLSFFSPPHLVDASAALSLLNPLSQVLVWLDFVAGLPLPQVTTHTVGHSCHISSYLDSEHLQDNPRLVCLGFFGSSPPPPHPTQICVIIVIISPSALFSGKLLLWSSQFDRLWWGCQGFSSISSICLAKALFFPAVYWGILLILCMTLQTALSFTVCCDVNRPIFSLNILLRQDTCSPSARPVQMTSLKGSARSPNSACRKLSSFSLLSSFHLWDPSLLGIFIYCIKDRAKGEGGITQTFSCSKRKHCIAGFAVDRACISVTPSMCLHLQAEPSCRSVLFGDRLCSQRGESLSILTFIFNL